MIAPSLSDQERARLHEISEKLREAGRSIDAWMVNDDPTYDAALTAMPEPQLLLNAADLLASLSSPGCQKTCASCRWWEQHVNSVGVAMGDGRCFKGVRVGNPTRQNMDGGLYTHESFGCNQYEAKP